MKDKFKSRKYKGDLGNFLAVAEWDNSLDDYVAIVKLNIWGSKLVDVCDFEGRVFDMDMLAWNSYRDMGFGVKSDIELERMVHEVLDPHYIENSRNIGAVVKALNDVFEQAETKGGNK